MSAWQRRSLPGFVIFDGAPGDTVSADHFAVSCGVCSANEDEMHLRENLTGHVTADGRRSVVFTLSCVTHTQVSTC